MKKTILIVDDDQLNRQILLDMLKDEEDYSILSANNGEVACKLAQKLSPDLILMDWSMPGVSGKEATETIKGAAATRAIPVIIITGVSEEGQLQQIENSGADGRLIKPVEKEQLLLTVERFLKK